ncbi:GntR family transcriptional regulator [uncultured Vagococcus sp.]|uniref:GntR family transcriptional regulator n=1 Tax=uncultured Vagococcus sp. TaxID=189676 RepID=UPI0028D6F007|nr:GntR family transcriptional regulator [uncultured Vagococcus sp.]
MTKYEQIANVIRKRIKDGDYPVDSWLPNQVDLVEEFQVSRVTIKKAVNILTMEGLVYSQRGAGTRVLNNDLLGAENYSAKDYEGLSVQMKGRDLKSHIIYFNVEFPDELVQKRLMINAHQPVYKIIRLRIVDGSPYVIEHSFMPTNIVINLTEEVLEKSIYDYIHQELGLGFAGALRNIKADRPDDYDREFLKCGDCDPILELDQVIYLKDGKIIDYSRSRSRFDQRSYSVLDVIDN